MAESNEEKGLLGPTLKPHRRYGSTSVNMKKPENIVVHFVTKEDTIQGIALKYEISVEHLKQHNKLWSAGSLFLHDYLEVPVSKIVYQNIVKKEPSAGQIPSISPSSVTNRSIFSQENDLSSVTNSSCHLKHSSSLDTKSSPNGLYDCSEKSTIDILARIDSNIATMKSNIEKMDSFSYPMIGQMEVEEKKPSCKTTPKRHSSESSGNNPDCWNESQYQNGTWQDPTLPPKTIVTNPGRTITMSLKRLLTDHEQFYEL